MIYPFLAHTVHRIMLCRKKIDKVVFCLICYTSNFLQSDWKENTLLGIWTVARAVREVGHAQICFAVLIANAKTDFCECCTYHAEFMSVSEFLAIYNSWWLYLIFPPDGPKGHCKHLVEQQSPDQQLLQSSCSQTKAWQLSTQRQSKIWHL